LIAEHACRKHSGRVGRSTAAKEMDKEAVRLAVAAHVRHHATNYDELLLTGLERWQSFEQVNAKVSHVKEALKIPRPNIVYLAGANGIGPLGMSPEEFYGKGDKDARSELLRKTLETEPPPLKLGPAIRDHWIEETGYSFPSGHAFAAMFFATFFLSVGVLYISTPQRWLSYLLLPWALAVCYSRLILRVHTPTDITVGGLEGLVLGFVALLLVRAILTAWHNLHSNRGKHSKQNQL